jgi:hypothetical protein
VFKIFKISGVNLDFRGVKRDRGVGKEIFRQDVFVLRRASSKTKWVGLGLKTLLFLNLNFFFFNFT